VLAIQARRNDLVLATHAAHVRALEAKCDQRGFDLPLADASVRVPILLQQVQLAIETSSGAFTGAVRVRVLEGISQLTPLMDAPLPATCPICLTARVDRVILSCGHTICSTCLASVTSCHVCKGLCANTMRIFLS